MLRKSLHDVLTTQCLMDELPEQTAMKDFELGYHVRMSHKGEEKVGIIVAEEYSLLKITLHSLNSRNNLNGFLY